MREEVNNFKRLFGALSKLEGIYDRDETIADLVWQYTDHRTTELKQIRWKEYERLCLDLEAKTENSAERRKHRSVCLRLMQELGIDTTDWTRINIFCSDKRICGKPFYPLTIEELRQLQRKLRAIGKNGGLQERKRSNGTLRYEFVAVTNLEGEKPTPTPSLRRGTPGGSN